MGVLCASLFPQGKTEGKDGKEPQLQGLPAEGSANPNPAFPVHSSLSWAKAWRGGRGVLHRSL